MDDNGMNERELRELLKRGVPPARVELRRDLWPRMRRRIEQRQVRVPWTDWALAALAAGSLLLLPHLAAVLLYQL